MLEYLARRALYMLLLAEMIGKAVEGQWFIGTVGMPPSVLMLHDRVGNMQRGEGAFNALPPLGPYMPDTWFLRQ